METSAHRQRIQALQAELGDALLVLFSAPELLRNNDVHYEYRQDSDFYYLTGLGEPGAKLVVTRDRCILFIRPKDKSMEVWDGPRISLRDAKESHGATEAYLVSDFERKLPALFKDHPRIYHQLGQEETHDALVIRSMAAAKKLCRRGGAPPTELVDSGVVLHEMRRVKQAGEVELMLRASEIAKSAHTRAMRYARPGTYEYEIQAEVEHTFRTAGCSRAAYQSIIGSGPNATILHYVTNRRQVEDGDLILIDAGCEYEYYASDITRTFPANGTFSPEQRAVYEVVLAAQVAAIESVRPGATLEQLHAISLRTLTQGLIDLKLIRGPIELALSEQRFKPFFMHGTGHYLGMDVHDVGRYHHSREARPFESGVVLTVEPGLYIARDNVDVPVAFRGIGVRIEDDILVTDEGNRNLTAGLAKSVEDVEALCRG